MLQLAFGSDGVQDVENDPEFLRPVLILSYPTNVALVSTILSYAPKG